MTDVLLSNVNIFAKWLLISLHRRPPENVMKVFSSFYESPDDKQVSIFEILRFTNVYDKFFLQIGTNKVQIFDEKIM